jgi:hypothetical protein
MENKSCPCKQLDGAPLPQDKNLICIYWDLDKNTCNMISGIEAQIRRTNER